MKNKTSAKLPIKQIPIKSDDWVRSVLTRAADFSSLLYNHPDAFNFSSLSIEDKIVLFKYDKLFFDLIDVAELSAKDKLYALLELSMKKYSKRFALTDSELEKLTPYEYGQLVMAYFKDYIRVEKFSFIPRPIQEEIFVSHPEWVIQNASKVPKLTSQRLDQLAQRKPSFVDTYVDDFLSVSTTSTFWIYMIKYNSKYKDIFIKSTTSLITKTDVRSIVEKHPDIIKLITEDTLANSKLTGKEWVLLINKVIGKNPKIFEHWSFQPSLIETMRLDITAELLNGKARMSKQFQTALKGLQF